MSNDKATSSLGDTLFVRMQDMNRVWLERLRDLREMEAEFGSRLLRAKNPTEAMTICNEWMAKRLEAVGNEHNAFTAAWLDLVSDTMRTASASSSVKLGRDTTHSS
jgi:hypothetical protein